MLTTWDRQARMCFPHLLSPLKRAFKLRPEGRKGTSREEGGKSWGGGGGTGAGAAKTQSLTREVKGSGVRTEKETVGDRLGQGGGRAVPLGNGKALEGL